jgi:acetamidase/formamidase
VRSLRKGQQQRRSVRTDAAPHRRRLSAGLARPNPRRWPILVKVKEAGNVLKLEVDGAEVKRLRSSRERSATQKEFAHEVGISERRLREIENAKA